MLVDMLNVLLLVLMGGALAAKEIPLTLEHAVTPMQLARGLMHRAELEPGHGMTFNYSTPQPITIWMLNTRIDLDVAFLDEAKVIKEIHEMKCNPAVSDPSYFLERSKTSSFPATYVLEMPAGWFASQGIKPGDRASWTPTSSQGKITTK